MIITSRTSSHPSSDKTSNSDNIAFPMLSKLKFRGFALCKKHVEDLLNRSNINVVTLVKKEEKNKLGIDHFSSNIF